MTAAKQIATRVSYGNALLELAKRHKEVIVMDADLAHATQTCLVKDALPEQFIECGIAEANMMSAAAGMSTMGFIPFASTFAMFAVGRAYEQVRNSIGYPHLNVKICASHGGVSIGEDGASHQCCEDLALMRTIPGMTVLCPADDVETRQMVQDVYEMQGPVYMRLARFPSAVFHTEEYHFKIGKGEVLRNGKDIAIIATGMLVAEAIQAGEMLAAEGISARIINMATIKPLDEELVLAAARECTGGIITAEDHSIIGGLGEAVAGCVSEKQPAALRRIGVRDVFGHSGPGRELMQSFGLCAANLVAIAKEMLAVRA